MAHLLKRLWRWLGRKAFQVRYGFDPAECWNLDVELARWLAPRLAHLSKTANGYPAYNAETMIYDNWIEELEGAAERLRRYPDIYAVKTNDEELRIRQEAQDAMGWVARRFQDLWD